MAIRPLLLKKTGLCALWLGILLPPHALRAQLRYVEQRTANGVLEGVVSADGKVRTFKGIPFAAPPVGYSTWKWMEMQLKTGKAPVFRYRFEKTVPLPADAAADAEATAPHASEIEFVFQVLSSRKLPWRPEDRRVSDLMGSYWSNFAKTGDPNGEGMPRWPAYSQDGYEVMHPNAGPRATPDEQRARYQLLDGIR